MAKLCGDHAVSQLLKSQMPVHCLYVESGKDKLYGKMIQHARANHIPVKIVNQLSKVFPGSRHQGIGAEFEYQWAKLSDLEVRSNSRFLMLDRVQDPHNFGACLRSAASSLIDESKDGWCSQIPFVTSFLKWIPRMKGVPRLPFFHCLISALQVVWSTSPTRTRSRPR